ncbi:hypothetical protein GLA29479_3710 [Lysobacter antibioticus]|uniref:hypothetical protein n=1 Tax=Lysobacter antibioticus TaxID=84531 RepID=UPI0007173C64|nr:hypothetical protein [Lysobacter antibioticus]ALN64561.1 hypothetical protein GLA29479_3710 [Lysobacter antibioticus]
MPWTALWPLTFSGQGDYFTSPPVWDGRAGGALGSEPRFGARSVAVPQHVADQRRGALQAMFGEDFFDRIHVEPRVLNLGNVSSVQQRAVRVWNAYRARALTLTDAALVAGEGIVLTAPGATPLPFAPLSERTWQIAVGTDGPPVIAATLSFQFAGFGAIPVVITGQRIVAWAFAPDWSRGVLERLAWKTDILTSPTQVEQRRGLRSAPRRSFEARMIVDGRERVLLDLAVFGWGGRTWALPIWPDVQWLANEHALGVRVIACDPAHRDFRVGGLVQLCGKTAFEVEVAEVEAIGAISITLRHPTTKAWPRGTRLYPVRTARLAELPKVTRLSDQAAAISARFDIVESCDWPTVADAPMYRGHPVLAQRPDETEALSNGWQRVLLTLDNDFGRPFVMDPADWAAVSQAHHWRMHGRAERSAVRSWLYTLRGRQCAVWRPTHADDLVLVANVAGTATALDVANVGLARFAGLRPGRRDLRIELRNGQAIHRRITAAVALDDEIERLTIDTAIGVDIRPQAVQRISFLVLSRGDSDEAEIEHHTDSDGAADASLVLRAVRDPDSDDSGPAPA